MRCWTLALSLLVAAPAAADEIFSFSPHDVTVGTELTIVGDFRELDAGGKPRVVGERPDFGRGVGFQVISVSSEEIHALARRFPPRQSGGAVGLSWSLRVLPPNGGAPLTAPASFLTVGPELIDVAAPSGEPGDVLQLLADNVGTGRLSVLFGEKRARRIPLPAASAPVTLPPPVSAVPIAVLVPELPSGAYPISLQNAVGASPAPVPFTVLPSTNACKRPRLRATLSDKPAFDGAAFTEPDDIAACDGKTGCARRIEISVEAGAFDAALASPGQRFVRAGIVHYREGANEWSSILTLPVSLRAESEDGPIRGSVTGPLGAVGPNAAFSTFVAASFCAMESSAY